MEDVQSHAPTVPLNIDRVGVRELRLPLLVRDRARGSQQTVASVDLGVDLPSAFKGPHIRKAAPASGSPGTVAYACRLTGELDENGQSFLLDLDVPVMTVCPCSKAISREGAHSQRAIVRMRVRMTGFSWLEEFLEMAEESGSSAVYTLLKREDEKFVTEHAFAAPAFVEDVVRNVAQRLSRHTHVDWFSVEVESMESIHNHNAFARIERSLAASGARKGARP